MTTFISFEGCSEIDITIFIMNNKKIYLFVGFTSIKSFVNSTIRLAWRITEWKKIFPDKTPFRENPKTIALSSGVERIQGSKSRPYWVIRKCSPEIKQNCPAWEFRAGHLCRFINGTICQGKVQMGMSFRMTLNERE